MTAEELAVGRAVWVAVLREVDAAGTRGYAAEPRRVVSAGGHTACLAAEWGRLQFWPAREVFPTRAAAEAEARRREREG
jgi:hypothetical protein